MANFILIRHGEPRYDEVRERGYFGMGHELGRLTDLGVKQAEERALDNRLEDADLILASPYTRALQTAAIISRITNIPLTVENDLHEWMPDTNHQFLIDDYDELFKEYIDSRGVRNNDTKYPWESYEALKKRVVNVLNKYKDYKKVIVVCHGLVIHSLTNFDDQVEHCGVREITIK